MIKRKIALMLAVFTLAAPIAQASEVNFQSNKAVIQKVSQKKDSSNKLKNMLGIDGKITNITKEKNQITIHIKGKSLTEKGYDEVKLVVNKGTKIYDEASKKEMSLGDMVEGMMIKAYFPTRVTRSLPPIGYAKEIIVSKKDAYAELQVTEGNIVDISKSKNNIMVHVQHKETLNPLDGQINFTINEKTVIYDEANGEKLNIKDIKDGMKIKVYYDPVLTCSIPPMGYAKKVVIVKEQKKDFYEVSGNIIDTFKFDKGVMAYVKSENESFFTFISHYSQILNRKGDKELNINDIKENTRIKLYFNQKNSLVRLRNYLPNMCLAEKVVVMGEAEQNLTGTKGKVTEISNNKNSIMASIEGQKLYKNGYDNINLNINADTEIINGIDGSKISYNDIKKGTIIIGFYGQAVTRSLPPIGTAKRIIVLAQENQQFNCTEGQITEITEIKDSVRILIDGKKNGEHGYDKIKLTINEDTKIFKENGTKLAQEDLNENMKVKGYYGLRVTRSLPPIGTAKVLIVE